MNWRRRQLRQLLSAVLTVAVVAVVIMLGIRYHRGRDQAEQAPEKVPEPEISALGEYTALRYTANGCTLSFARQADGSWLWTDDTNFPLDDTTVRRIVELCGAFKPQQTLTEPGDAEGYGLSDPVGELTITDDRGKSLTLTFGNATTDGESRYVMENGQTDPIFIMDGTLYETLCVPIYDMYALPTLPRLTSSTLESITLVGTTEEMGTTITVLSAQRTEGTDSVTWRSNGANVTDDLRVQALLSDLRNVEVVRCVDYRPSEEAAEICGFGEPAAVLTAVYRGEDESLQNFILTVGNVAPDFKAETAEEAETGETAEPAQEAESEEETAEGEAEVTPEVRYVRINTDESIFLLSPEALDPLMQIAMEGLE